MYNNNIELLKLLNLNTYDIDLNKTSIVVDPSTTEITIDLYLNQRDRTCPKCGCLNSHIKDTLIKKIDHPVLPGRKCIINLHQKKYVCPDCGKYFLQFNPLVKGSKKTTILGEIYVLERLKKVRFTFSDVANDLSLSTQTVIRTFDEHVSCSRRKLTQVICIDEKYLKKLSRKKFCCVIYDPLANTVLDIMDTRLQNDLIDCFARIPMKERLAVKVVNMDMYDTYRRVAYKCFPNCICSADSFHVIKNLNEAMNNIRIAIQANYAQYKKSPDPQKAKLYWLLKTFHYYFVEDFDNIKYTRKPKSKFYYLWDKHQVLDELLKIDDKLTEAYYLKEEYREFNLTCDSPEEAKDKLEDFIERFKKSPFEEFKEFAKTLSNWHDEILNSFVKIQGKRMNNSPMESLNGRLDKLISDGYGYTNFTRFRNRAMYSLNKDESIINF